MQSHGGLIQVAFPVDARGVDELLIPSDSGSRRAASGGAFERRKMATASKSRTAATTQRVLRVRLFIGTG
jgi:hypothetical protein